MEGSYPLKVACGAERVRAGVGGGERPLVAREEQRKGAEERGGPNAVRGNRPKDRSRLVPTAIP